jgi:hypothetical protein
MRKKFSSGIGAKCEAYVIKDHLPMVTVVTVLTHM